MRVNPQQLPEQRARVLSVAELVVAAAAVPGRDVEQAIGRTELEGDAVVVVRVVVRDLEHKAPRAARGDVRRAVGIGVELLDPDRSVCLAPGGWPAEVDVEQAVARARGVAVARVERLR